MYIDTHCHVNFGAFKNDAQEVLQRSLDNSVWAINIGTQKDTSQRSVELAEQFEKGVYASIGLHPIHLHGDVDEEYFVEGKKETFRVRQEKFNPDYYAQLAKSKKVVAVGEVGLDYYRRSPEEIPEIRKVQLENLKQHLLFAAEHELPLVIHCREAHDDLKAFVAEHKDLFLKNRGVVHCFSGDLQDAEYYWQHGLKVSFTGLITFSDQWNDFLLKADLKNILIETDSPYMTPAPNRGKRNEPLYVKYVADHIAHLRGITVDEVAKQTFENSIEIFPGLV